VGRLERGDDALEPGDLAEGGERVGVGDGDVRAADREAEAWAAA